MLCINGAKVLHIMRRLFFIIISLVTLISPLYIQFATAHAGTSTQTSWLNTKAIAAVKLSDLPANQEPFAMGIDCVPTDFPTGRNNNGSTHHGCVMDEPFGKVGDNYYVKGPYGTLTMELSNRGYFLPQSAHGLVTFNVPSSWSYGAAINIGNKQSTDPKFNSVWGWPPQEYYTYDITPEKTLSDATGQAIHFDWQSVAYSPNGEWMAAMTSTGGIMLYDTATFQGKTIDWNYGNMFYNEAKGNNLAVSNDGRYVAINANLAPAATTPIPTLRVYDATTCADQAQYESNRKAGSPCTYKDLWTGLYNGVSYGGVATEHPELEYPRHLRFTGDGSLTFDSVNSRSSATTFNVARYTIPFGGSVIEPVRLLAMGDSYISGEGAYSYRNGTDTSNNKCHQSTASYPYLLGAAYAAEYHSVACSGAVMANIYSGEDDYENQTTNKQYQRKFSDEEKNIIKANYVPGNIEQYDFLKYTNPNTILLSIGGNDIAFADIVKRCVLSFAWGPCYHKQSERKSLLLTIYSKFHTLKSTYSKILSEAPEGARLYVMGYPQVVSPVGSCGVSVHLDDSERQFASLLINRLNETVKIAAESSGAVYVDVSDALVGHKLCDTHDDGVNGLTSGDDKLSIGIFVGTNSHSFGLGNESYHPTALGHQLLSNAIAEQTKDLTKQPSGIINATLPKITDEDEFVTTGAVDDGKARRIEQQEIVDANIVSAGEKVTLGIDANTSGLQQGSTYQAVFHSDEVVVASGTIPESGKLHLEITVPKLSPGIHSLHVYTTDTNGEDVDVTEDVYVVADSNDFDGDGILNADDSLPFVNETEHVIVPEEPKDNPSATDDGGKQTPSASQDLNGNAKEDVVSPIITNAQGSGVQLLATKITSKSIAVNQDVDMADTDELDETLAQTNTSQILPKVLDAVDTRAHDSLEKKHSEKTFGKGLVIIAAVFVCIAMLVIIYKRKRSRKESGRM